MKTIIVDEIEHVGGVPGLRVGARSVEVYTDRALFKWADGECIVGCPALYDWLHDPCFKVTKSHKLTWRETFKQYTLGLAYLLHCFGL